jgi:integrase
VASAFVVTRKTKTGDPRFVVRYRLGGRAWPVQHGGSFQTMKDARARRDVIAGELAAGRNPADLLQTMSERPKVRTFAEWAEAYRASRPDIGEETRKNMASHLKRLLPAFGDRDPAAITASDVQEWIGAQDLKPSSLSRYLNTLRQVIDFVGVEPNPARDKRVKLPKIEAQVVEPPSAEHVDRIISHSPPKWRLPLRVLEQTGMRVGERHDLEWRDVDLLESRFRIRNGKTRPRVDGLPSPSRSWRRSRRPVRLMTAPLSGASSLDSRPTSPRTSWPERARRPGSRTSIRTI